MCVDYAKRHIANRIIVTVKCRSFQITLLISTLRCFAIRLTIILQFFSLIDIPLIGIPRVTIEPPLGPKLRLPLLQDYVTGVNLVNRSHQRRTWEN